MDQTDHKSGLDLKLFTAFAALVIVGFVGSLAYLLTRPEPTPPPADFYQSLKLSDFTLTERSGRLVTRDELRGKILVVGFVFTSCGIECTISGETMAKIQEGLGDRDDVRLVSLTVDPMTDTPAVLTKFAKKFNADEDDWLFLTGEKDPVMKTLQSSFLAVDEMDGFLPTALPAGRLPLVTRLYLLDRNGQITGSYNARLPETPVKVIADLEQVAKSQAAAEFLPQTAPTKAYATRGIIKEIEPDLKHTTIAHEEIPDFMPKMTMRLNVKFTNELRNLRQGDEITFKLFANDETHWIQDVLRVDRTIPIAPGTFEPAATTAKMPSDIQLFPDFEFTDEHDRPVKFSDFEGKVLTFTFIFTRCPLPDFCPRMENRFGEARDRLLQAAGAPPNWQFLSISFDPKNDTPEVLRAYAKHYRKGSPDRWLHAVASDETLKKIAPLCDLQYMAQGGSITHNLRTIVLDPKRRIHRVFAGNEWTAKELAGAVVDAATKGSHALPAIP